LNWINTILWLLIVNVRIIQFIMGNRCFLDDLKFKKILINVRVMDLVNGTFIGSFILLNLIWSRRFFL